MPRRWTLQEVSGWAEKRVGFDGHWAVTFYKTGLRLTVNFPITEGGAL
jgi:hypothetical protein